MVVSLTISLLLTQAAASLSQGRDHVAALRAGRLQATQALVKNVAGPQFRSSEALKRLSEQLKHYGQETKLISEGLVERDGLVAYTRSMAVANWARGVTVELLMDGRGRLVNGVLNAAHKEAPTAYGNYRALVQLRLPLEDEWFVLWGGRSWADNRHASVSDMRFALDLLQRRQGSSARQPGLQNEDFFAWNQPVLAPADGVVAVAIDGVSDNPPHHPLPGNLYGNVLVIDHGTEEYTLLGHLKRDSISVKPGDRVTRGQRIARVGNSGMSTEPHLHFQLMDTADWKTAHGLPLQLVDLIRNGLQVKRTEPRRGDIVSAVSPAASR
jgi:hypothetical protein